jgi:hypothetical protein
MMDDIRKTATRFHTDIDFSMGALGWAAEAKGRVLEIHCHPEAQAHIQVLLQRVNATCEIIVHPEWTDIDEWVAVCENGAMYSAGA